MSEDLSNDDLKSIERDSRQNKIIEYLRVKDELSFNVGDILICMRLYRSEDGSTLESWKPVSISHSSSIPKRYKVVWKNEHGVCWIKQLKADGSGLCTGITCLAGMDLSYRKMMVDPDYVDHIVLNDSSQFEFFEAYTIEKNAQNKAKTHNKSINLDTSDMKKVREFFLSKKSGDRFWFSDSHFSLKKQNIDNMEYEFKLLTTEVDNTGKVIKEIVKYTRISKNPMLFNYNFTATIPQFHNCFFLSDSKPTSYEDFV
jgi:hypothetical protein